MNRTKYFCYVLAIILCVLISSAFADEIKLTRKPMVRSDKIVKGHRGNGGKSIMQGDLNVSVEEKKEADWQIGHKRINRVFRGVIDDLKDGSLNHNVPNLNLEALRQLAAAYLFCSKKQGPCVFILNSLLELDTLRSIKDNKISCLDMKRFWKIWIDNHYEKQLSFDVKLGLIGKFNDFKANKMPKYVQCDKSVKKNFSKDHIPSDELLEDMKKTLKLMNWLEKKYGDVTSLYVNNG